MVPKKRARGQLGIGVSAKRAEADSKAFSKQTKDDAKEAVEERKDCKACDGEKESCFRI